MLTPFFSPLSLRLLRRLGLYIWQEILEPRSLWASAGVGLFLVSVPVFVQAPLVRTTPWLSLALTLLWLLLGYAWQHHPRRSFWGQVFLGFSWSWLAGSLYWGWFRWDPLYHLPLESLGLPFVLANLWHHQEDPHSTYRLGNWFYLGSLLGTAITDFYFYIAGVMPYWAAVMRVEPTQTLSILQEALLKVETPWGVFTAMICAAGLTFISLAALRSSHRHHWVFGGAVLGTLMVDSLFGLAALL